MKCNTEMDLIYPKTKIQWCLILAIFSITLVFSACKEDCNCPEHQPIEPPYLKVVNQTNDNDRKIASIQLVGYEFTNLSIKEGDSQTFNLNGGMPGGYENININVRLSGPQIVSRNIEANFNNGDTTTITMKGCISYEGCNGFYLE